MSDTERLLSLDAFRGATIAGMILVNSPGLPDEVYAPVAHAAWNGWTYADWIFPFFLFIVGVAMTLSFSTRKKSGMSAQLIRVHIVRRAAVLFVLGLIVNGFPFSLNPEFSWETLRIPGVLQRIAVCYLVAGLVAVDSRLRTLVVWTAMPLVFYWLLVMIIPVPGYGAGVLEPKGSLLWYVDSTVLGSHTWIYSPASGFDPEGIISTIPAISTTFLGVLAGRWMNSDRDRFAKCTGMFVAGLGLVLAGQVSGIWLPINKNLWTSSYVLFTAGWAGIVFAASYALIDIWGYRRWVRPLVILGTNAIAVYVFSELVWSLLWAVQWDGEGGALALQEYAFQVAFKWVEPPKAASLAFAVSYLVLMYLVAWGLWKRRLFIKV